MKIVNKKIGEVKLYENNPRNNDGAVDAVAESIKQFGFKVPIVVDNDGVIVCGHTRYKASVKLGLAEIPCIIADDLTPEQIKAYRLADNKAGEIATLDNKKLGIELGGIDGIDMRAFGFTLDGIGDDVYSTKCDGLFYDPNGELPPVSSLCDKGKYLALKGEIENAKIPDDIRDFLLLGATRHIVFDYAKIADFYANSDKGVQELMEKSALVIIDYEKALELGYARMSECIRGSLKKILDSEAKNA